MTEVLAHTISMLRGRNGSNSSRNLEWDALDTLAPVCPPAKCYIHAEYIHRVLHTYRLHAPCSSHICRLHVPCSTHMQATCTSALCMQIAGYRYLMLHTYCLLVVVQVHANCSQQFSMQSKTCKQLKKGCSKPTILSTMYIVANNFQCRAKVANSSTRVEWEA